MIVKVAMDEYAASLEKVWAHDRSQTVGASEIGMCMRKTFYEKNERDPTYGVKRDPDYLDGYGGKLRGTMMENYFWAPAMKSKYGDSLLYSGPDQVSLVSGFLSATPDGLLTGLMPDALALIGIPDIGADCIVVESKTIDPRANLDEAKPANVFQTHVQIGMIRESTSYRPNFAVISYMDASFWDTVTEFIVPFDPDIYAVAKDRARKIMSARSAKDLEPEGYLAGGNECNYCPFTRACGVVRMSVPQDDPSIKLDPQFEKEIAEASAAIARLSKTVDSDSTHLRTLKQALKDRLREKKVRRIPGVVSWSSVKGKKSYDNEAIKQAAIAAGVDISQFEKTGESTDRLVVS